MKNRYANETHFTKCKFRQFLQLFCKDLTALQIASLTHLNRNTVNLWINRIRARILFIAEQEKLCNADNVQADETFFTNGGKFYPKWKLPYDEVVVFGMIDGNGKVYARIIDKATKEQIIPIVQECCKEKATIFTDGSNVYYSLSKLGYKHGFVNHVNKEFSRYENDMCITTNRIEGFWGCMKVRLAKFRGVKWDNLALHIAESVWRFNHRQDDIYRLLLKEFRVRPLS
jgi:transposase-like protein